jgi:hypothetical protein
VGIGIFSICSFLYTVRVTSGGKKVEVKVGKKLEVRRNVSCTASMSTLAEWSTINDDS